jgi:hypothetical protein
MAFGFLGDIVEGIGDVLLPKGTRGSTIGAALGAIVPGVDPRIGANVGAKLGGSISTQLSGKSAVSSPSLAQAPQGASESAISGADPFTYRPTYTAGFSPARLPGPVRDAGTTIGGAILENVVDFIPDINISKFFGGDMQVCGTRGMKPYNITQSGCLSVTRKQQHQLKKMVEYIGISATADMLNLNVNELAMLLTKRFPPRRKGITASQLTNAKRINRTIMGMAKQLTDACKTPTTRRR